MRHTDYLLLGIAAVLLALSIWFIASLPELTSTPAPEVGAVDEAAGD